MYDDSNITAYHESGRIVVAWELGLAVLGATIVPNPEEGYGSMVKIPVENRIRYADWSDEDGYLYAHLVARWAGIAASERFTGRPMSEAEIAMALESTGSDHRSLSDLILALGGPDEARQVEVGERAERHARNLVCVRWEQIEKVAGVLLERETLDEGGCRRVLEVAGIV